MVAAAEMAYSNLMPTIVLLKYRLNLNKLQELLDAMTAPEQKKCPYQEAIILISGYFGEAQGCRVLCD
jgi:hypothetical protein